MSRYIALDGPDGCGKSTQALRLVDALRADGLDVMHVREPGSTAFAERLRAMLLDPAVGDLDPVTEALAFSAARRELILGELRPALDAGRTVVAERCFASTLVYQGFAAAGDTSWLVHVTRAATGGVVPDALVLLDLEPGAAEARRADRTDRIEAKGSGYHDAVVEGFRRLREPGSPLLDLMPERAVHRVDAGQDIDAVHRDVLAAVVEVVRD